MKLRRVSSIVVLVLALASLASRADAQWYFAGYLGANHTRPDDVRILQPASSVDLTYSRVTFDAKPFQSPQYYGWRLGRGLGSSGRVGIEVEFIHLKVIAETDRSYVLNGHAGALSVADSSSHMDAVVQRYAMTHGLNFLVVNLVSRTPIGLGGGRLALVIRGGAGPTLPHAETSVGNQERQQYEWAGTGIHAAAGIEIRLHGRWSAVAEYKLTHASPTISIAGGTGRTTALTQHVAVGVVVGR